MKGLWYETVVLAIDCDCVTWALPNGQQHQFCLLREWNLHLPQTHVLGKKSVLTMPSPVPTLWFVHSFSLFLSHSPSPTHSLVAALFNAFLSCLWRNREPRKNATVAASAAVAAAVFLLFLFMLLLLPPPQANSVPAPKSTFAAHFSVSMFWLSFWASFSCLQLNWKVKGEKVS